MSATVLHNRHHPQNGAWRKPSTRARARTNEQALKADDLRTGNAVKASGNVEKSSRRSVQIAYTGRYLDQETGLYYFRARYYDGSLGRFVNRDPEEYIDGVNQYAANFIPNNSDPFGLRPWKEGRVNPGVGVTFMIDDGISCECEDCPCPPNKKGTQKVKCKAEPKFSITIDTFKIGLINDKKWTVNTVYNHEKQHADSLESEIQKIVDERNKNETSCLSPSSCASRAANAARSLKTQAKELSGRESGHKNPNSPKNREPGKENPPAPPPTK